MTALLLLICGAAVSSFSVALALHGASETFAFSVFSVGAIMMILSVVVMARS